MGTGTDIVIRREDLDERKMIVLHPVVQMAQHGSPLLAESWSAVKIQPDTVDTYHDFRFAPKDRGLHALTAVGLAKIAAAAGIQWISAECVIERRERRPDGHVYIAFKAVGAVRQPNGELFKVAAHQDLDTADELEELIDQKIRKWRRDTKSAPGAHPPAEVMAGIHDDAKRDILQIRDNALALVETKAQNRVIRKLLSLSQVYSEDQLARPFAVPRLVYRPDLVDARELEGRRAVGDVYGTPNQLGPGSGEPVTSPGPDADVASDGRSGGSRSRGERGTREGSTTRRSRGQGSDGSRAPSSDPGPSTSDDKTRVAHAFVTAVAGDITNPCLECGWAYEWAGHKGTPVVRGAPEQGTLS